ncbi:MAG TPA: SusD/RagB family nutrient-binding outer membrane lipoprotein [Hanamia sp.]|nr:SusD/RagB family nutrient-binding outer membrane lipoprotein [Hanamia sp.]
MKHIKKLSIKNLFYILTLISGIVIVGSCTKKYDSINVDKNSIATLGAADLPFLFSQAESTAPGSYWNYQIAENLFSDQYCQYFACEATYFPSDRLVIRQDWVGAAFNPMYTTVMPQLQSIFASTDSTSAEYAMANVWWVYTFQRVTDYWGPIPYFSAGVPGNSVAYDPQDKIYYDFISRLKSAVTTLRAHVGENHFGSYDLVYGGDVDRWLKFANSLLLRIAIRISKVDPATAKTVAEAAVADGVMTTSVPITDPSAQTSGDDAFVQRSAKGGPDGNGLQSMSDWNEFRMSASMASVLKGYQDPRLPQYFLPALNTGLYSGIRNGLSVAQLGDAPNQAANNSHVGKRWSSTNVVDKNGNVLGDANSIATAQNVMVVAESYFNRAEGALLGWNMGGTAKDLYDQGITNSLIQWNVTNPAVQTAYINSTNTPIPPGDGLNSPAMTNIPVKFDASNMAIQLEQIATQKWLALYPDGMEAWADYRRSHVLKLYPVVNSDNPDITNTSTQWIRRIPFLLSEQQTNGAAVEAAVPLLNGPDKVTTPLWWDKN